MPLLQLICLYFNQLDFDELVIIDSFPVLLCQPVRNHQAKVLKEVANIGYCASKNMWFYGFKIHLAVTESAIFWITWLRQSLSMIFRWQKSCWMPSPILLF